MNIEELEAPAPAMDRQCSKCLAVKPFTIVHWPNNRGKPTGMVCRLCLREAQRSYDRPTRKSARIAVRAAANAVPSAVLAAPASAVVPAKNEAAASVAKLPVRKLDVTRALDAGATVVNESAKGVLETGPRVHDGRNKRASRVGTEAARRTCDTEEAIRRPRVASGRSKAGAGRPTSCGHYHRSACGLTRRG